MISINNKYNLENKARFNICMGKFSFNSDYFNIIYKELNNYNLDFYRKVITDYNNRFNNITLDYFKIEKKKCRK